MAGTIADYVTPSQLYRYRSLRRMGRDDDDVMEEEFAAIEEGYIWTSPYMRMNDPMEGTFFAREAFDGDRGQVLQSLRYGKESTGIACFSETPTNELMWAHYADEFRGFCLAYDFSDLRAGMDDECTFSRLFYTENPPELDLADPDKETNVRRVLSSKSQKWAYEREWRIFTTQMGAILYGNPQVVRTIYVGNRMPYQHQERIRELGERLNIEVSNMDLYGYQVRFDNTGERRRRRRLG
jgi:hypothetical protein